MNIKEKYLEQLQTDFTVLTEIVLEQIATLRMQMQQGGSSEENVTLIDSNENLIDNFDVKIREQVVNGIFLFTPRASDLRKIIAYHDMTIYLERIGDLVINMAHALQQHNLGILNQSQAYTVVQDMLERAEVMVKDAVLAFTYEDNAMARKVIAKDHKINKWYKEVAELLVSQFENIPLPGAELRAVMMMHSISYNIERIGDNASNIAEAALYLTEGVDVRHTKA